MNRLTQGMVAEFLGTFALVFFGAGSIIMTHQAIGAANLVTIALAHGVTLSIFVTGAMYISGGQFNPAVSLALLLIGKQPPARAGAFIASQLLAACCAAGMLILLLGDGLARNEAVRLGATIGSMTTGAEGVPKSVAGVFGLEALMTFALMFSILMSTVDGRAHKLGGFCIGLTVTAMILAFGPLTGASMNPARTLGPAVYGYWDMLWVYMTAPVVGAAACALVYKAVWSGAAEAK